MKKQTASRRSLKIETLEDRVLFSAVPAEAPEPIPEEVTAENSAVVLESSPPDSSGGENSDISTQPETAFQEQEADDAGAQDDSQGLQLLVVDSRAERVPGQPDVSLSEDLMKSAPATVQMEELLVDRNGDGIEAVRAQLETLTADGSKVEALHIVTHGDQGSFTLGNRSIDHNSLLTDNSLVAQLQAWQPYLSEDADILLYGCNIAEGEEGMAFMQHLAALTSADIAASTDLTGQNHTDTADWDLEADTGPIEAAPLASTLDVVLVPEPVSTLNAPGTVKLGETFTVTATFDNSSATDTGYGPWIDIAFDRTGVDGIFDPLNPETGGTGAGRYDGITLAGSPTVLGNPVQFFELTIDDTANGGLGVQHPFAVDTNGDFIYVNTTTGPFAPLLTGFQNGDGLLVVGSLYGSFTPDQPVADVEVQFQLSDEADLESNVTLASQAGFRLGADPINNPSTDPSIIGNAVVQTVQTEAALVTLTKTVDAPENETATGPNYQRTYRISVDIAEGQSVQNLHVYDDLADEIQYVAITGSSHSYTLLEEPSTIVPGGSLGVVFDSALSGAASLEDAWLEISFYVPRTYQVGGDTDMDEDPADLDTDVLAPDSGDDRLVDNQAYGFFEWDPVDDRDPTVVIGLNVDGSFDNTDLASAIATAAPDAAPEHNDLEVSPLVVQKTFTVIDDGAVAGPTPNDLYEFSIDFQVSDYFGVQDIVVDDLLSDGFRFDDVFLPVLEINGNTYVLSSSAMDRSTWTVNQNFTGAGTPFSNYVIDPAANDGTTLLEFRISEELIFRGQDGLLLGGGIDPNDTDADEDNPLPLYNDGATTGRLVYRARILDEFTDDFPSGEAPLNPRDNISNDVTIRASLVDLTSGDGTRENLTPYPGSEITDDDSAQDIEIVADVVTKSIYAVNGIVRLVDPTDENSGENPLFTSTFRTGGDVNGAINVKPNDDITYRLAYTLPTGDVENLRFTDYFPLPIYDVEDPDQSGSGSWVFDNNLDGSGNPATAAAIEAALYAGQITYGPSHTLHTVSSPYIPGGGIIGDLNGDPETPYNPAVQEDDSGIDATSNFLRIQWGDFSSSTNMPAEVDVLVTIRVSSAPFSESLNLTNQVQAGEQNTQDPGNEQSSNDLIIIVLDQPLVDIYKGVVSSTQNGGVSAGGLTFDDIGSGSDAFSGTLTGQSNAEAIGALDLTSGTLPDAGDQVRFAVLAQNTGRSDAYDVTLTDTLPQSYDNDYADKASFMTGTNFRVFDGAGALLTEGVDYDLVWDLGTATFTVELTDITTPDPQGRLFRGEDATQAGTPETSDGSNAVLILYDLTLNDPSTALDAGDLIADAGSQITNTATLTNYAGSEGGDDHTNPDDKTDDAIIQIAVPNLSKTLIGTEFDLDNNNAATEAVIGELVTFELVVDIPEGETVNATIQDIMDPGLSFVSILSVTYASGVSSSNTIGIGPGPGAGMGPSNVTLSNTNGGTANQMLFSFGTITNGNTDNSAPGTVTIQYQAVVRNQNSLPSSPGNQAGTQLNNSAQLNWEWNNEPDSGPGPDGNDSINASSANVEVIEPALSINTDLSADNITYTELLTGLDAGDTVYIRYRVQSAGNLPTSFDIDLNSIIPDEVDNLVVFSSAVIGTKLSITDGVNNMLDNADFTITNNPTNNTLSLTPGVNMDVGESSGFEVILQAELAGSIIPSEDYSVIAEVEWTSIDGTRSNQSLHTSDATERDGTDGFGPDDLRLNNYSDLDDNTIITTPEVEVVKTIVDTSEAHTSGSNVTIGEIIRYRVTMDVPELTIANFQVQDLLPSGLTFLNDGTATIQYVADVGFDSTLLGNGLNSLTPETALPDGSISTSASLNEDTYGNGTDVFFKLGNFVNQDRDADVEQVIIEFNVLVNNTTAGSNDAGDTRDNQAQALLDGSVLDISDAVTATIVEPNVSVDKTLLTPSPYDGANPIQFQVVVTNNSGSNRATAFEVEMVDVVPAFLGSITQVGVIGTTGTVVNAGVSIVGNTVTLTADSMDIGATMTLVYQGILVSSIPAGQPVENTANLTYTGLPGSGTVGNSTGSDTPGASGTDTGERDGSDGEGGDPNDYADSDMESFTVERPALNKTFQNGSISADDSSDATTDGANLRIGEQIIYDILITLPEGTTEGLIVRDIVPEGLRIDTVTVVTSAATATQLTADWNGSVLSPTIPLLPVSGSTNLDIDFGDVSATSDNDLSNNSFVVRVSATVINIAANQNGDVLNNTASYFYDDPVNGSTEVTETDTTDTEITVVEPELEILKTIESSTSFIDGGDNVEYQLLVRHTGSSTSDAREILLTDTFSAELDSYSFASAIIRDGVNPDVDVSGLFTFNPVSRQLTTTGDLDLLLDTGGAGVNQELVLRFTAVVPVDKLVGTDVNNTATITWSSGEGGLDGDDTGTLDERTGSDGEGGSPNDHADSDSANFETYGLLDVSKVVDKSEATIGEIVTYTITFEVAEGQTVINWQDTLPAGLVLTSTVTVGSNPDSLDITGLNPNSLTGQTITVTSTSAGTDPSLEETSIFTLTYQALVQNIASNQGDASSQTTLTNDVDANSDLNNDGDINDSGEQDNNNQANTDVIEPVLQIEKTIISDDSNLDAGDTLTYQLRISHSTESTADAFELILNDTLPVYLNGGTLSSALIDGTTDVSGSLDITNDVLSTTGDIDLAMGEVLILVITTTVNDDTDVGQVIDNSARLQWSNLDGGQAGDEAGIQDNTNDERTGAGSNPPNDYNLTDNAVTNTRGFLAIVKTADVTEATIGDTVTYDLQITVAEGRTEVAISDVLPAGMVFVANSMSLLSNPDGLDITGLTNNSLTQSLVVTSDSAGGGTVENDGATAHNSSFTLRYQAFVQNVAGNQGDASSQTTLTNAVTVQADLNDDDDTGDAGETLMTSDDVDVIEPVLQIEKTIISDDSNLDAGDTLTYQLRISHSTESTADAFELILNDTLPVYLNGGTLSSALIDGTTDVSSSLDITNDVLSTTGDIDLAMGEVLILVITTTVNDDTDVGQVIDNSARLQWSNRDGGQAGDENGIQDNANDERTGAGSNPPNDYDLTDNAVTNTRGFLAIVKSADVTEATIGDTVTYTLDVTVAEGRTEVAISDVLPAGMVFVANSMSLLSNPDGLDISGLTNNSLTQSLVVTSDSAGGGTVENDGATAHNSTFTLTYQALVQNVATNQGDASSQTTLTNAVTVQADLNDDDDTGDGGETLMTSDDVDVIEPVLQIEKTIISDDSNLDAGDTLTYQLRISHSTESTADAFELILNDTLPVYLNGGTLSSALIDGTTDVSGSLDITNDVLSTTGDIDLAMGEVLILVITTKVNDDTDVGQVIDNSARLQWSNRDGGQAGDENGIQDNANDERTGAGSNPPNDYDLTDNAVTNTRGFLAIVKSADVENATIGQVVTYSLEITVAEGRTEVDLNDVLPAGMVFVANSASISANADGLDITGLDANSLTQSLVVTSNRTSGTVENDGATAHNSTFTLSYQALVQNVVGNQGETGGQTRLTNNVTVSADLNDDDDSSDGGETLMTSDDVDVIEPDLQIVKSITSDTTNLDAGDTLTYELRITHTALSTADAFELILDDTLPIYLNGGTIDSALIDGTTDVSASLDMTADVLSTTGNIDLALGETLVILISTTINDDTDVGQLIENTAELKWSSLDGGLDGDDPGVQDDVNDERTGGGDNPPNDYLDDDTVSTNTRGFLAIIKTADVENATIGQVVTYSLEITVAEGRTEVDLNDVLPAGMVFVANSASISANADGLDITGLNANSLTQSLVVTSNRTSGTVEDDGSAAQNSTFTLSYQALVQNVVGNQGETGGQTRLTNNVTVSADLNDDDDSSDGGETLMTSDDVDVIEPDLQIVKSITSDTTNLDAGDTLTYELRITHTALSTADAFELILDDTLPIYLNGGTIDSALIDGTTDVSASLDMTADVLSTTGNIDLALGETLVILISTTINDDTDVGQLIENTAELKWSSLDGGLDGDDPGVQDDVNDERTGGGSNPPNDYLDDDTVSTNTRGFLAIVKTADVTEATIGQVVTYSLEITVAEGRTEVALNDVLPAGMVFVANSASISANADGLDISGLDANSLSQNLVVTSNRTSGTVENDGATAHNSSFTISYQALVQNVVGNQGELLNQTRLTNSVTVSADLNDDDDSSDGGETITTSDDVDVIEPVLQIEKSILSDTSNLDAGDTLSYQLRISHTLRSTADAFELILDDTLPIYLNEGMIVSALIDGTSDVSGSLDITNDILSTTGNIDLARGEVLIVVISTTINDDTDVGQLIDNTAELKWSSLDGGLSGDDPGVQDDVNDERTGEGINPPNDYSDSDNVTTNTRGFLAISKTADVTQANIGQIVNYTLQITVAEGRTELDFTDVLPTGMVFVANSMALGMNPDGLDISGLTNNSLTQSLVVTSNRTSGTVENDGATAHNSSFTVTYQALVQNVASNQGDLGGQTILTNAVNVTADLNDDDDVLDAGEDLNTNDDVQVIEPVLEISKVNDDNDNNVGRGQTITYTFTIQHSATSTSDAYEVMLNDPLPLQLENYMLVSADLSGTDVLAAFEIQPGMPETLASLLPLDIAQGQVLTLSISGQVRTDTPTGDAIVNDATITWSSLDGNLRGDESGISDGLNDERTGTGDSVNDHINSDDDTVVVGGGSIGDRVWWDINANGRQDAGELGLPGLTVNLYYDINEDGVLDAGDTFLTSQVTDSDGQYLFTGLPTRNPVPGGATDVTYLVEVLPIAGLRQTFDLDGLSTKDLAGVALNVLNRERLDVDFGYTGTGQIGDRIWDDNNRNNLQDGGEPGVNDIPVTLTFLSGSGIQGQQLTLTQNTAGDGNYLFTGLIPGNYSIQIDPQALPAPRFLSFELDGNLDGLVSINLNAGESRLDVDYGLQVPPPAPPVGPVDPVDPGPINQPEPNQFLNRRVLLQNPTDFNDFLPIVLPPIYSGAAAPGTTLVLILQDGKGQEIARQTVVADAGGNYLASFPGANITLRPVNIYLVASQPVQRAGGNAQGLQPEFGGSFHTSNYLISGRSWLNMSHSDTGSLIQQLQQAMTRPLSLGFEGQSVELDNSL